jgi:hypothetical protein
MTVRLALFLSSYALLFLIGALRFDRVLMRVVCAALFVMGVLLFVWVLRQRIKISPAPYEVDSVSDEGGAVAGYLATYLLPFVTVQEPDRYDLAAYLVFLAMLAVVHMRTNLIQVNPLLYLMGYRVLRVHTKPRLVGYLITPESDVRAGDGFEAVRLADGVLMSTLHRSS